MSKSVSLCDPAAEAIFLQLYGSLISIKRVVLLCWFTEVTNVV